VTQLTFDESKNHDLDNNDNFSPDDQWLVYDTRTDAGGIGGCQTIERVNVATGKSEVLYQTQNPTEYGPGAAAVSYSPVENKVVFIHGLLNCIAERPYAQWRRIGVMVDVRQPNRPIFMDARDVTSPFTPGALRGGTHRHEWSGDGQWIGYTYNDAVMKALEDRTGEHWNLRTIGVSRPIKPVTVDRNPEGENNDGEWFSVLVVKVVPNPKPGSDEISHAADDSWVGIRGYQKANGSWQRARSFLGTVRSSKGEPVKEVFIVDIPEQIDMPGDDGPLEGSETTFPMPPRGTVQRRLTFTAESQHPGCSGVVRCSPSGDRLAFLAKDSQGIDQVFFISPWGSEPRQVTRHSAPVQGGVRWHPDGSQICYICDKSIFITNVSPGAHFGKSKRMTEKSEQAPSNLVWSHNGKLIAFNKLVGTNNENMKKQIFLLKL